MFSTLNFCFLLSVALSWLPLDEAFGVLPFDIGAVIFAGNAALLLLECSNGEEYDRQRGPFWLAVTACFKNVIIEKRSIMFCYFYCRKYNKRNLIDSVHFIPFWIHSLILIKPIHSAAWILILQDLCKKLFWYMLFRYLYQYLKLKSF